MIALAMLFPCLCMDVNFRSIYRTCLSVFLGALQVDVGELRFYGRTSSAHGRRIHFKTWEPTLISYVRRYGPTGIPVGTNQYNLTGLRTKYEALSGHQSYLPMSATNAATTDHGNNAALNQVMWDTSTSAYWTIGYSAYWGMDDYAYFNAADNIFTMWVRAPVTAPSAANLPTSCRAIKEANANAASGEYNITVGGKLMTVHCDMDTDGGGWMLVLNYARLMGDNPNVYGRDMDNGFPLAKNATLGSDQQYLGGRGGAWGHAVPSLLNQVRPPFSPLAYSYLDKNVCEWRFVQVAWSLYVLQEACTARAARLLCCICLTQLAC